MTEKGHALQCLLNELLKPRVLLMLFEGVATSDFTTVVLYELL